MPEELGEPSAVRNTRKRAASPMIHEGPSRKSGNEDDQNSQLWASRAESWTRNIRRFLLQLLQGQSED